MALGGWTWAPKLLQGSAVCPQGVPEGLEVPSAELIHKLQVFLQSFPSRSQVRQGSSWSVHSTAHIPSIHPGHHEDQSTLCTGKGGANKAHHQLLKVERSHLYWP